MAAVDCTPMIVGECEQIPNITLEIATELDECISGVLAHGIVCHAVCNPLGYARLAPGEADTDTAAFPQAFRREKIKEKTFHIHALIIHEYPRFHFRHFVDKTGRYATMP